MAIRTVTGVVTDNAGVIIPNAVFTVVPIRFTYGSGGEEAIFGESRVIMANGSGEVNFDLDEGEYMVERRTLNGIVRAGMFVDNAGPWDFGRLLEIAPNYLINAAQQAIAAADRAAASAAEAEATAETLADLATLQQLVADAQTARDEAVAASEAAFVSADVYADTAAGLAAVAEGDQFAVVSTDGQEVIRYREDAGPVATEVARFPSAAALVHLYGGRGGITSGVTSIGIEATDYAILPRTLKKLRVDLDAGSALASVIIGGVIVHQVAVTGGTPSLETGLSLALDAGDELTLHLAVLSGTPATYSAKLWG